MATKFAKPLEASQATHVADMPPMDVVTEGIPTQEHIGPPSVAPPGAPPGAPERRRSWLAWALAGVIGALLVVVGIFAVRQESSPNTAEPPTGAAPQAEQEYGEGAQAAGPAYSGPLEGPALPYFAYLSIAPIPSIAAMSIPSIPSTEPIPLMSIASVPSMSIEPIPSMSIPSIQPIQPISIQPISIPFPSTPMPSNPSTPVSSTFPSIDAISIPSIPSMTFPSFPSIPSISIPPIESIPSISIPPFPTM